MERAVSNTTRYRYTACTQAGQAVAGDLDARDLEDAHAQLAGRGLVSVLMVELSGGNRGRSAAARPAPRTNLSSAEIIRLAEDLEMLSRGPAAGLRPAGRDA